MMLSVVDALRQWGREGFMQDTLIQANGVSTLLQQGRSELATHFLSFSSLPSLHAITLQAHKVHLYDIHYHREYQHL